MTPDLFTAAQARREAEPPPPTKAQMLRILLKGLHAFGPATVDDIATRYCVSVLSLRPRATDAKNLALYNPPLVEETGQRGRSQGGKGQCILRITAAGRATLTKGAA